MHANYYMLQAVHTRRILFDIERSFYLRCRWSANWRNDKLGFNSRDCPRVEKKREGGEVCVLRFIVIFRGCHCRF